MAKTAVTRLKTFLDCRKYYVSYNCGRMVWNCFYDPLFHNLLSLQMIININKLLAFLYLRQCTNHPYHFYPDH